MLTLQGTYLTNERSESGVSFSIGAMVDAVWQGSKGTPTNMTHDIHRTIGWTLVNSLYISPSHASVLGRTYVAESADEMEWLNRLRSSFLHYKNSIPSVV